MEVLAARFLDKRHVTYSLGKGGGPQGLFFSSGYNIQMGSRVSHK